MKKMTGWALAALVAATQLPADRITSTTVACPTMEAFRKIREHADTGGNKELYIMQQGCVVLTPKDKIHVIDPDRKMHGMFLKVQIEHSGEILYVQKSHVKVEQAGTGNIFRF